MYLTIRPVLFVDDPVVHNFWVLRDKRRGIFVGDITCAVALLAQISAGPLSRLQ